jgi:opacity protein-like surface antigen
MRFLAGLVLLFAAATPASAEWFADVYGGVSHTPRSDLTFVIRPGGRPSDHTFRDVKWDPSAVFGARAGYWLEAAPWYGIGLDVFRFNANIPTQTENSTIVGASGPATLGAIDIAVTAIALDLVRLRYPLMASAEYSKGRLQPYVTAGPALFRIKATNKANGELSTQPGADSATGYKLGAGLSWQLTRAAAIFGEYRYTHVRAEPVVDSALSSLRVPLQFDLNTHHLVAGASFSF